MNYTLPLSLFLSQILDHKINFLKIEKNIKAQNNSFDARFAPELK